MKIETISRIQVQRSLVYYKKRMPRKRYSTRYSSGKESYTVIKPQCLTNAYFEDSARIGWACLTAACSRATLSHPLALYNTGRLP